MKHIKSSRTFWIIFFCIGIIQTSISTATLREPGLRSRAGAVEAFSKKVAPLLKPVSKSQWTQIAGSNLNISYQILNGDTLYGISAKLFGNPKYWPKVWALNSKQITNPHRVEPTMTLSFLPGTEQSILTSVDDSALNSSSGLSAKSVLVASRSDEWKYLPVQDWERVPVYMSPEIDSTGFDQRSVVKRKIRRPLIEIQLIAYANPVRPFGKIIAGRSENDTLSTNDVVYVIESEGSPQSLSTGKKYLVLSPVEEIENPNQKKETLHSYLVLGRVDLVAKTGRTYSGIISQAIDGIPRESILVENISANVLPTPVASNESKVATILTDPRLSSGFSAQTRQVLLTLGSEDGIQTGMVFRSFQTTDPRTDLVIAKDGLLAESDVMVLHANEDYSVGVVIAGKDALLSGTPMTLLTDVSSVLSKAKPLRSEAQLFGPNDSQVAPETTPTQEPAQTPDENAGESNDDEALDSEESLDSDKDSQDTPESDQEKTEEDSKGEEDVEELDDSETSDDESEESSDDSSPDSEDLDSEDSSAFTAPEVEESPKNNKTPKKAKVPAPEELLDE